MSLSFSSAAFLHGKSIPPDVCTQLSQCNEAEYRYHRSIDRSRVGPPTLNGFAARAYLMRAPPLLPAAGYLRPAHNAVDTRPPCSTLGRRRGLYVTSHDGLSGGIYTSETA